MWRDISTGGGPAVEAKFQELGPGIFLAYGDQRDPAAASERIMTASLRGFPLQTKPQWGRTWPTSPPPVSTGRGAKLFCDVTSAPVRSRDAWRCTTLDTGRHRLQRPINVCLNLPESLSICMDARCHGTQHLSTEIPLTVHIVGLHCHQYV